MSPEGIVAIIAAIMGPITAMFTLYIKSNATANKKRDAQMETLKDISFKLDFLAKKYNDLPCREKARANGEDKDSLVFPVRQ